MPGNSKTSQRRVNGLVVVHERRERESTPAMHARRQNQIQGRDELSIAEKVKLDSFYLINRSTSLDLKILARTVRTILKWEQVSH